MHLLKLGNQIAKAIMLKLAQQRVRNVGRYVAAAGALADLGGKSLGTVADSFSVPADSLTP
jgi:hypothetical protein